jgi:predicted ATP-dependent endonuclease of OLD family
MKQKIIIKNFGPIKDVEMEIDDFTIFIGPQTSGKSTIAKSVFFFLSLRDDMIVYLIEIFIANKVEKSSLDDFKRIISQKFNVYWNYENPIANTSILKYFYSTNNWIELEFNHELNIKFSNSFQLQILDILASLKVKASRFYDGNKAFSNSIDIAEKDSERKRILMQSRSSLEKMFCFDDDLLFIPAGRSILSTLSEQIQNIAPKSLDSLMKVFIERINASKGINGSDEFETINFYSDSPDKHEEGTVLLLKTLCESILQGSYFYDHFEDGGDNIKLSNQNYIKLLFASSGQQETVWIIQMVLLLILNRQKVFIVIEEPEAHLFPKTQKDILNLIVLLSNTSDNKIFITTHSPYILTSLNNNIYAYQVGQENEEKVDKIIDKRLWMNPNKVQAYFVGGEGNKGKIRSIIHPELQIIQTEEIDSASSINNEEYDLLFDLD